MLYIKYCACSYFIIHDPTILALLNANIAPAHFLPTRPRDICLVSDCAVCADGYGRGVSYSCHFCDDTAAHVLIAMGVLFTLVMLFFLLLAVVFLIGGLDAIDSVRQTVTRNIPFGSNASAASGIPVPDPTLNGRPLPKLGPRTDTVDTDVAPSYDMATGFQRSGGGGGANSYDRPFQFRHSDSDDLERTYERRLGTDGGVGAGAVAGAHIDGVSVVRGVEVEAQGGGKSPCWGLGDMVKRLLSRLPLNKLKILVVVWQILAVFSSITGVEFPASYATFLSWISVVNLDLGNIFSASCVVHSVNFYARLLLATVGPLVLAGVLVLTYHMAKHRSGIGSAGVIARRAAWSRHVAAGLLLTFLVSSESSLACDVVCGTFGRSSLFYEGEACCGRKFVCTLKLVASLSRRVVVISL